MQNNVQKNKQIWECDIAWFIFLLLVLWDLSGPHSFFEMFSLLLKELIFIFGSMATYKTFLKTGCVSTINSYLSSNLS